MKEFEQDVFGLTKGLVIGGTGLTLGSSMIGSLPSTPATSGIQSGFTTFAGFTPTFATIGATGITLKQMRKLEKQVKGGLR